MAVQNLIKRGRSYVFQKRKEGSYPAGGGKGNCGRGVPAGHYRKIAAEAVWLLELSIITFRTRKRSLPVYLGGENIKKRNAFYKIIAQMELEPLDKIKSVVEMHFTGLDHHRIIQGYYSEKILPEGHFSGQRS